MSLHDSGGERQLILDLADRTGVEFARLSDSTLKRLAKLLDPGLPAVNPLDAWSTGEDSDRIMAGCLREMLSDDAAAIGAVVHDRAPLGRIYPGYVRYMEAAHEASGKPVFLVAARQGTGADPLVVDTTRLGFPVPDTQSLELLIADLNGVLRGKRVPRKEFDKVFAKGINLPGATTLLDIKGDVVTDLHYGSDDGDPDVYCHLVPQTLGPVPWSTTPLAQALITMSEPNGEPYFADPRHVLARAARPLCDMGLKVVIAIELEFYLLEGTPSNPTPKVGRVPGTTQQQDGPQVYSPDELLEVEAFLNEVEASCKAQNIPASAAISEFSPGQFEINLHHVDDPARACDDALLLKRAIKGVARQHDLVACFMAKPFAEHAGSGMHVHVSLLDERGRNVFAAGADEPDSFSNGLRHAAGGLVATMADFMAIFLPNANSYRRLQPGFFAPMTPNWGLNHRNVAIRVPLSGAADKRLEHRTAGADANPYMVVAAVLAGIHHGLSNRVDPGPMVEQGAVVESEVTLPVRWEAALTAFKQSDFAPRYLGEEYARVYAHCQRVMCDRFNAQISNRDYEWYLRAL